MEFVTSERLIHTDDLASKFTVKKNMFICRDFILSEVLHKPTVRLLLLTGRKRSLIRTTNTYVTVYECMVLDKQLQLHLNAKFIWVACNGLLPIAYFNNQSNIPLA